MFVDKLSQLAALPDFRPKSAHLEPGESVTLYGGITFTNNSHESVDIQIIDHLVAQNKKCGLYYSINGGKLTHVDIGSTVLVDKSMSLISVLDNMF